MTLASTADSLKTPFCNVITIHIGVIHTSTLRRYTYYYHPWTNASATSYTLYSWFYERISYTVTYMQTALYKINLLPFILYFHTSHLCSVCLSAWQDVSFGTKQFLAKIQNTVSIHSYSYIPPYNIFEAHTNLNTLS